MTDRAEITVYSAPGCIACKATERALAKAGIVFKTIDITTLPAQELEALKNEGYLQAPVVQTEDGEKWSGFKPERIKAAHERLSNTETTPATPPQEQPEQAKPKKRKSRGR